MNYPAPFPLASKWILKDDAEDPWAKEKYACQTFKPLNRFAMFNAFKSSADVRFQIEAVIVQVLIARGRCATQGHQYSSGIFWREELPPSSDDVARRINFL